MPSLYREGTPQALKRHWKWLWLAIALELLVFPIGLALGVVFASPLAIGVVGFAGVLTGLAGVTVAIALSLRDRAHVRRLGGRACTRCLYDLSASPTEGHCPECGTPYTILDIVRRWRDADQSYQAKKLYTLDE